MSPLRRIFKKKQLFLQLGATQYPRMKFFIFFFLKSIFSFCNFFTTPKNNWLFLFNLQSLSIYEIHLYITLNGSW